MSQIRLVITCCLLLLTSFAGRAAEQLSQQQMRSLDDQVQEIKSDVLHIATDLQSLEERLLFPSNTQVAVFVTMQDGDSFRLDAVQLEINGDLVAHYIYSFKELEALQGGGVQRLYTGNIGTGEHMVRVTYNGKLGNGEDVTRSGQFSFTKGVEPKMLGVTLAASGAGSGGISLGDW